jgi:hypothetical protein
MAPLRRLPHVVRVGIDAMFCYRTFETVAVYFGLRGSDDLSATYGAVAVMLVPLYPAGRWYRTVQAAHPNSYLKTFSAPMVPMLGQRIVAASPPPQSQ